MAARAHSHSGAAAQPLPCGWTVAQGLLTYRRPVRGSCRRGCGHCRKIKLGTAVCLVVEHDPIVLAKKAASLDFFCGGRFIFGIGIGWNAEEMENHGTVFKTRYQLLRERIEAIKRIWCSDQPEYHGRFVNFNQIQSFPKPVHKPHPPIFFGGDTPLARQRVVDNYRRMDPDDYAHRGLPGRNRTHPQPGLRAWAQSEID